MLKNLYLKMNETKIKEEEEEAETLKYTIPSDNNMMEISTEKREKRETYNKDTKEEEEEEKYWMAINKYNNILRLRRENEEKQRKEFMAQNKKLYKNITDNNRTITMFDKIHIYIFYLIVLVLFLYIFVMPAYYHSTLKYMYIIFLILLILIPDQVDEFLFYSYSVLKDGYICVRNIGDVIMGRK